MAQSSPDDVMLMMKRAGKSRILRTKLVSGTLQQQYGTDYWLRVLAMLKSTMCMHP